MLRGKRRKWSAAADSERQGTKADLKDETPPGVGEPRAEQPKAPRLTVDLARRTITLDGATYDVESVNALHWVEVLAEHPGEWISGKELERHDKELANTRT